MTRVPARVWFLALLSVVMLAGACGGSSDDTASDDTASGDTASEDTASEPELQAVDATATSYDYDYVIPAGTGERMDAGEEVEVVPAELDVKVGENIRVVNEDVRGAVVGIFWVPAESSVAMEFNSAGTLSGECDVHPSGEFTINVTEV